MNHIQDPESHALLPNPISSLAAGGEIDVTLPNVKHSSDPSEVSQTTKGTIERLEEINRKYRVHLSSKQKMDLFLELTDFIKNNVEPERKIEAHRQAAAILEQRKKLLSRSQIKKRQLV